MRMLLTDARDKDLHFSKYNTFLPCPANIFDLMPRENHFLSVHRISDALYYNICGYRQSISLLNQHNSRIVQSFKIEQTFQLIDYFSWSKNQFNNL